MSGRERDSERHGMIRERQVHPIPHHPTVMSSVIHSDIPEADEVRAAFERLAPDTTARWGTMDAPAMLEHCLRFNEIYLGRRRPAWPIRILARLFAGPFLKRALATSPREMKRGIRTLPALKVDPGAIEASDFEDTRTRLLSTFDEIDAVDGRWNHPLYGRIEAERGKAMARHHAAHHLHQFGLLGEGVHPPGS